MDILRSINWIDVLVVILILRISYVGFRNGLSHEIFPFSSAIIISIIGLNYYHKIGSYISSNLVKMPIALSDFLSFLILILATGFILKLVRVVLDNIIKVEWHPLVERLGGALLAMLRAVVVTSLVLITIALMPFSYLQWSIRDRSLIGMYALRAAPEIYDRFSWFIPGIKAKGDKLDKEALIDELVSDKILFTQGSKEDDKKKGS